MGGNSSLLLWVTAAAAVASAVGQGISAFYDHRQFHRQQNMRSRAKGQSGNQISRRRFWIMALFPIIAWAAVGFDYYVVHSNGNAPVGKLATWGAYTPPGDTVPFYSAEMQFSDWESLSGKYKFGIIVRNASRPNIDRFSDKHIEVSTLHTIDGPGIKIGFRGAGNVLFAHGTINSIEFTAFIIPKGIENDQLNTIGDVKALGGKLVGYGIENMMVGL